VRTTPRPPDPATDRPWVRRPAPPLRIADGTPVTVVHLTAEYFPYARTGGLAEAANGLARFLSFAGVPTMVLMPLHRSARALAGALEPIGAAIETELGGRQESFRLLRQAHPRDRARVYFLEHQGFFDRAGIYGEAGSDYPDNAERWAFFCLAAVEALPRLAPVPLLLHGHDWHTALTFVYLRTRHRGDPWYDAIRTVLTVHNAGYQGHYQPGVCRVLGIPDELFNFRRLEWYGQLNLLKGGLAFADAVVTVSPSHSRELCTPEGGFGLHDVFRSLGPRFVGILNGIDQRTWDPSQDALIEARYSPEAPGDKELCKRAVQRRFGLRQDDRAPLFTMAARLVTQKGIDIILDGPHLLNLAAQFAFLGTGEARFEQALHHLAAAFPGRVAVNTRFNDQLEHELMAGGDFLLMPCQYEPCGLTQMRAQRYGTLPVVRRVGGLADTVEDGATGFVFDHYGAEPLFGAALRALDAWSNPVERHRLRHEAMRRDFSWERSVERYLSLYQRVLTGELAAAI
jgi:starch synthase